MEIGSIIIMFNRKNMILILLPLLAGCGNVVPKPIVHHYHPQIKKIKPNQIANMFSKELNYKIKRKSNFNKNKATLSELIYLDFKQEKGK